MADYVVFDVNKLSKALGEYAPDKDDIEGKCECGEMVNQEVDKCPYCGRQVVWKLSKVWRDLYGNPEVLLRKLRLIPGQTELANEMLSRVGLSGFATKSEASDWYTGENKLGEARIKSIINYVVTEKRESGQQALSHILNTVRRATRENRQVKHVKEAPVQSDNQWRNRWEQ